MTDLEVACPNDVRGAREVDADGSTAQGRETCGYCFENGVIPHDVDQVVVGRYTSKVHLSDDHDVSGDAAKPDNPSCQADGLAAVIGAEDFGPEDVPALSEGGDA